MVLSTQMTHFLRLFRVKAISRLIEKSHESEYLLDVNTYKIKYVRGITACAVFSNMFGSYNCILVVGLKA